MSTASAIARTAAVNRPTLQLHQDQAIVNHLDSFPFL